MSSLWGTTVEISDAQDHKEEKYLRKNTFGLWVAASIEMTDMKCFTRRVKNKNYLNTGKWSHFEW